MRHATIKIRDIVSADVKEAANGGAEKKELEVTLLREGPGNQFHKNYYTRQSLELAEAR